MAFCTDDVVRTSFSGGFRARDRTAQNADLATGRSPLVAIKKEPIDPTPQLRVKRIGQWLLPPNIEREIGIQVAKQDVPNNLRTAAVNQKRRHRRGLFLRVGFNT